MVERKTLATAAATAAVGAAAGALVSQTLAKPAGPTIYIADEKFREDLLKLGESIAEKMAERFLAAIGRTRISMTLPEIVQALTEQGYVKVGAVSRTASLLPGQKVVFEEKIPPGRVYVVSATKITTSPDGANSMAFYFDSNTPSMTDDAMVSDTYANMLYFWQMGVFLKCERFLRAEVQNITADKQSMFKFFSIYGWVEAHVWKKLVDHFFRVFRMEVLKE
jgi:hypothetical protein